MANKKIILVLFAAAIVAAAAWFLATGSFSARYAQFEEINGRFVGEGAMVPETQADASAYMDALNEYSAALGGSREGKAMELLVDARLRLIEADGLIDSAVKEIRMVDFSAVDCLAGHAANAVKTLKEAGARAEVALRDVGEFGENYPEFAEEAGLVENNPYEDAALGAKDGAGIIIAELESYCG